MRPGFDITWNDSPMGFQYGPGCFGPKCEVRHLSDIKKTLLDPDCKGPEDVYAIAMDVGRASEREALVRCNLLAGCVIFASGTLGREPVRSQGHVHALSASCLSSTPELYEVWQGEAIIYMQQYAAKDPGACYAVHAKEGELVLVPPGWAHMTINADSTRQMVFGAFCVRDYGFAYHDVRALHGLCHFPLLDAGGIIAWQQNPCYEYTTLVEKEPRAYTGLGISSDAPMYTQFVNKPDRMLFIAKPGLVNWEGFVP